MGARSGLNGESAFFYINLRTNLSSAHKKLSGSKQFELFTFAAAKYGGEENGGCAGFRVRR